MRTMLTIIQVAYFLQKTRLKAKRLIIRLLTNIRVAITYTGTRRAIITIATLFLSAVAISFLGPKLFSAEFAYKLTAIAYYSAATVSFIIINYWIMVHCDDDFRNRFFNILIPICIILIISPVLRFLPIKGVVHILLGYPTCISGLLIILQIILQETLRFDEPIEATEEMS